MYHVCGRKDEEFPDVIAGTVELNSHSAYALIDFGGIPFPIDLYVLPSYKKPMSIFAAMALQDEYEFGLPSMPVVSEFIDVFPEELPDLLRREKWNSGSTFSLEPI
ncbi:hypothetical protein V6N13_106931 [Hibiscus sabdariffa]